MTKQKHIASVNDIGVAVDVGSTSIGVCCVDLVHKTEILSFSFANPQHIYGADVITRIKHCIDERSMLKEMQICIESTLHNELIEKLGERYSFVTNVVYSGNTTMLHILRGFTVEGLACAPFHPVDLSYYKKIESGITYHYLPGISAFVGADILAGAHALQMGKTDAYELLIDLGTNGEMLLLNNKKGYATSTACGPVFDHVIGGAKYGSESVKVIANCVKRGLIDKTGKLADALFDKGIVIDKNFVVKQEHIRNFQLAKGAIYAGIQCLLNRAGITANEVSKVYISGGLGFHMHSKDAFILKMLPKEFTDKIVISGNTSLEGAKDVLLATDENRVYLLQEYDNIRNRTESFELANGESFQEIYMNSLNFI